MGIVSDMVQIDGLSGTDPLVRSWCLASRSIAQFRRLLGVYAQAHRKYHTLQHLSECIALLEPMLEASLG